MRRIDLDRDEEEVIIGVTREWSRIPVAEDIGVPQHEQTILVLGGYPLIDGFCDVIDDGRIFLVHRRHEIMRGGEKLSAGHQAAIERQFAGYVCGDLIPTGNLGEVRRPGIYGILDFGVLESSDGHGSSPISNSDLK